MQKSQVQNDLFRYLIQDKTYFQKLGVSQFLALK